MAKTTKTTDNSLFVPDNPQAFDIIATGSSPVEYKGMMTNRDLDMFNGFRKLCQTPPTANEIKENPLVKIKDKATGELKSALMLEIGTIESKLDLYCMGLWHTHSFKYQVIANEIAGDIILEYKVPGTDIWIKRVGAAAIQIQMIANSSILDLSAKIKNAIVKNLPALKAECIKNAAKSIGDAFGRSLNREELPENYKDYIEEAEIVTALKLQVKKDYTIETMDNEALRQKYFDLLKPLTTSERKTIQDYIKAYKKELLNKSKGEVTVNG